MTVDLAAAPSERAPRGVEQVRLLRGTTRDELWDLMWRGTLVPHWLGAGSRLPTVVGQRLVLSDAAGHWRRGRVVHVKRGTEVAVDLGPADGWPPEAVDDRLTIRIAEQQDGGVEIRIVETGPYATEHKGQIKPYLRSILDRLDELIHDVNQRRNQPRQAYIVIHGIGEQEPGRTLRALAESGVVGIVGPSTYVKPDRVSESFELRRITFSATNERVSPTTDVYELYWAHLIQDTTVAQVAQWARGLLFRTRIPRPLRLAWLLIWAVLLTVLVLAGGQALGLWDLPRWLAGGVALAIVALLWRVLGKGIVIGVLGDAARYLSPTPANVGHRQEIRQAGVDLLDRLHRSGDYDRIVIVGHSLGSVIAYDIVTYAWIRMQSVHHAPRSPSFKAMISVERAIADSTPPEASQDIQHAAWQQIRRNTQPWLVSDLVTLGSPLTYADFLMAASESEFKKAKEDRILPTCPPQTENMKVGDHRRCTYDFPYQHEGGREGTFKVFNHGAPFAVTRWTNLYFTVARGGLVGDIVGGPLAGQFGPWVRDVELPSPVRRFAHTLYWRRCGDDSHLDAVKAALGHEAGAELLSLGRGIPAYVIAERVTRSRRP
jgi:uncharacterized protein YndB with AHSA1/START domain